MYSIWKILIKDVSLLAHELSAISCGMAGLLGYSVVSDWEASRSITYPKNFIRNVCIETGIVHQLKDDKSNPK